LILLFLGKICFMQLSLGFSTCPNEKFIFDAMIHRKVDTEDLEVDMALADIKTRLKKFSLFCKLYNKEHLMELVHTELQYFRKQVFAELN